jgi:hypothetical protein
MAGDDDNIFPVNFGDGIDDPTRGMTPEQAKAQALAPFSIDLMLQRCGRSEYDFDKKLAVSQFTATILRAAISDTGMDVVRSAFREAHPQIPNDFQMDKAISGALIEYALTMMKTVGVLDQQGDLIHPVDATIMGKVVANLDQSTALTELVKFSKKRIVQFTGKSEPTRNKAED